MLGPPNMFRPSSSSLPPPPPSTPPSHITSLYSNPPPALIDPPHPSPLIPFSSSLYCSILFDPPPLIEPSYTLLLFLPPSLTSLSASHPHPILCTLTFCSHEPPPINRKIGSFWSQYTAIYVQLSSSHPRIICMINVSCNHVLSILHSVWHQNIVLYMYWFWHVRTYEDIDVPPSWCLYYGCIACENKITFQLNAKNPASLQVCPPAVQLYCICALRFLPPLTPHFAADLLLQSWSLPQSAAVISTAHLHSFNHFDCKRSAGYSLFSSSPSPQGLKLLHMKV